MVRIPYIKIPSVRVGGVNPTSDIGTAQGGSVQPTPITYLTQWKIVGNSEVHTLPYPDGVVLPTGYKRCEYLESDGTAYIELPFGFYPTDEMYAKAAFDEIIYQYESHIISTSVWNTDKNRFCIGRNSGKFAVACGSLSVVTALLEPQINQNTDIFECSYKNAQFHFVNNNNIATCDTSSATFGSESANICLLKNYNTEGAQGKIYEYRHKKANAEYRLIPCLDSNDTPCMYDVINNQAYYNSAGSGTLTYKLYPQPKEIWSCGEYNPTDGKYHILVKPQGGSIADIALTEPLRKVNDVADTIEFPSGTEGKALLTIRVEESGGELSPLDTPTTELVDAPQIEEAESYSMVISQGGKAVSWSSFTTESNSD